MEAIHTDQSEGPRLALLALALRVGLGLTLIIGGWNMLGQLLDPGLADAIVSTYLSPLGYINAFFAEYLFTGTFGDWLTPWVFLTSLSAFELASGFALIAGLFVRPLALVWGLLLWTFVMAIPVVTAVGVEPAAQTYTSPAMLVQIRDIGLSGMMFVLFNLGPGALSRDAEWLGVPAVAWRAGWAPLGLVLRLSVALTLIVGGAFAGLDHIQGFATSAWLLLPIGLLLAAGLGTRALGLAVVAIMLWFMATTLNVDASLIANLNGVKREFAFLAAGLVLVRAGGGEKFTIGSALARLGFPSRLSR